MTGKRLTIFACLLFVLILSGCAERPVQNKLLQSMVELDRLYVPSLVFTGLDKQRESELSIKRLRKEWDMFNRTYYDLELSYGLNIKDKYWKEDFENIESLIASAEALVKEEKLAGAHEKLEEVRLRFGDIRHRNGLDYFLDKMMAFHDALEDILTLEGKPKLSDKDFERLKFLSKEAQEAWKEVADFEIDAKLYGFKKEKVAAIKERIENQDKMLEAFAAALSSENADKIFQSARDLKPGFMVLYKVFGDFQPVFDRVIREKKEREEKEKKDSSSEKSNISKHLWGNLK